MFRYVQLTSVACIVASLAPLTARAWNSPGHEIIALIAYDQLKPETRAKALDLLRAHPRFRAHFENAMPREVLHGSDLDKDQWIFAHAATWPDQVRDGKGGGVNRLDVSDYSRPLWHYIDDPIFLNDNERRQLQSEVRVNRSRDLPTDPDDAEMNVVQALKNSSRILADKNTVPADRSVHLCWLLHLTGDSHQPLHSCALYTTHRFRSNDHGGNYIPVNPASNLHSFWDTQISTDEPFETIRILATDLDQNGKLQAAGKQAATELDPGKWIDESFELATRVAYSPELLKQVAAREGHSHLGPIDLPPSYRANAEDAAEIRAIEAGYRLAATLEKLLN